MREIRTTEREVSGEVSIWAIPNREWIDGEYRFDGKWNYELKTDHCYTKGAVKVHTTSVTLDCPKGIDLRERAVSTLRDEIKEEKLNHFQKIQELESQINQLLMLTYQPEEPKFVVEVELDQ